MVPTQIQGIIMPPARHERAERISRIQKGRLFLGSALLLAAALELGLIIKYYTVMPIWLVCANFILCVANVFLAWWLFELYFELKRKKFY